MAINGDNVAGCSTARVQQLLDDAGETVELLLLCRETRLSNKLHTLKDYLAPSVADDEVLRAIKADVQQGLQQSGSASANSIQQEHCRPGQAAAQQEHQHQLLQPSALQHQHRILPVTSRPPRHNERDGAEYNFVSRETFEQMVQANIFLEWGERDGEFQGCGGEVIGFSSNIRRSLLWHAQTWCSSGRRFVAMHVANQTQQRARPCPRPRCECHARQPQRFWL